MSDSTIRPMTLDEIDVVSGGISYDQAIKTSRKAVSSLVPVPASLWQAPGQALP